MPYPPIYSHGQTTPETELDPETNPSAVTQPVGGVSNPSVGNAHTANATLNETVNQGGSAHPPFDVPPVILVALDDPDFVDDTKWTLTGTASVAAGVFTTPTGGSKGICPVVGTEQLLPWTHYNVVLDGLLSGGTMYILMGDGLGESASSGSSPFPIWPQMMRGNPTQRFSGDDRIGSPNLTGPMTLVKGVTETQRYIQTFNGTDTTALSIGLGALDTAADFELSVDFRVDDDTTTGNLVMRKDNSMDLRFSGSGDTLQWQDGVGGRLNFTDFTLLQDVNYQVTISRTASSANVRCVLFDRDAQLERMDMSLPSAGTAATSEIVFGSHQNQAGDFFPGYIANVLFKDAAGDVLLDMPIIENDSSIADWSIRNVGSVFSGTEAWSQIAVW